MADLILVYGGTTGGTDGVVNGPVTDPENNIAPFPAPSALDTPIDAHMRGAQGESSDTTFSMPAEWSVSFAAPWTTWYTLADAPAEAPDIGPVNYPIKLKQTAYAASESGTFTTDGTFPAGTAPTLTGTLALTAGDGTLTIPAAQLVASDNVGVTGGEYRVNAGAWEPFAWTGGDNPQVVISATNGTPATVDVRAKDAAGNYSNAVSDTKTPVAPLNLVYSEANYSAETALYGTGGTNRMGQSFTGDGKKLDHAKFYLKRTGTLSGNLVARLYAHTGTFGSTGTPTGSALASSSTVAVGSVDSSAYGFVTFEFDNTYTLVEGTKYFIVVDCASVTLGSFPTHWIGYGVDNTSPSHPGNLTTSANGTTWAADATLDSIFSVATVA